MRDRLHKKSHPSQISRSLHQLEPRKPLVLPQIRKNRPMLYDDITVSPDHIRISSTEGQKYSNLNSPRHARIGFNKYSVETILKSSIFAQDRIVQKQLQYDDEYQKMKRRLKWKAEQRRRHKQGLSLIYDKFIKLL